MRKLHRQFVTGQRLQKHVRFLYDKGSMYNVYNGNLLYHGCVPVDSNGAFDKLYIDGEFYHGRALLDKCDEKARAAYVDNPYKDDVDFMWFLWGGEKSPLCGRRLKTFEMEYVTDKSMWEEPSNPYYSRYYAPTPFTSEEEALINNTDIETSSEVEENDKRRMLVKDTDIGKRLIGEIDDLHKLLENYRRL